MKAVKISLALLVLACCVPAMAYKTAVFQNGVANADAYTDANYKADFVCVMGRHDNQHFSNYNAIAALGWEQDGSAGFSQDQGYSSVLSKWDIKTLRGHVKYIHSGYATWYTVAKNSTPGGKVFGIKGTTGYKDVICGFVQTGVTDVSNWGDAHPTTAIIDAIPGSAMGCTYKDFGTSTTRNVGAGWGNAVRPGPSSGFTDSATLISKTRFQSAPAMDSLSSVVLTMVIPQAKLADWLYPERPGAVANCGLIFKWYAASPFSPTTSGEYECFFFADDETDEAVPASLGGATSGYNTNDIRSDLTGTAIAKKACRPSLTVLYEEGTNVPVELSSFDVE